MPPHFKLPPLVLGLWRLTQRAMAPKQLHQLLETAVDAGIHTLDLADIYGGFDCQPQLGQVLKADAGLCKRLQLISKCGIRPVNAQTPEVAVKHYDLRAKHIQFSVDNSLRDLGVEQLALLLLHRPDPLMNADEVAQTLLKLISEGKVAKIGVSNFSPTQWDLIASRLPENTLVTNQVELSLVHTSPLLDGSFDVWQQKRIAPMIWSPLGGGQIFRNGTSQEPNEMWLLLQKIANKMGLTPMQVALAWLRSLPIPVSTILGTLTSQRLLEAVQTVDVQLERQDWYALLAASRQQDVA